MYTQNDLNAIYERVAQAIDISDELFEQADEYYKKLGKWIDEETPDYKITNNISPRFFCFRYCSKANKRAG